MKHSFCDGWEFIRHWTEAFGKGLPVPKQQAVRLPHTCREVPLHYASPADYEMVCGYRKQFRVPPVQAAPRLFVRFDGAAHQAVVRINGKLAGQHRGGYTGFAVEITDLVDREGENLLTVQLDTREDPAIPPFGFVIDYLTYGGLYREVWLEATAESRLTDLFVYTPTLHEAVVQWTAELTPAAVAVRIRLETADGTLLAEQTAQAAETGKIRLSVPDAQPWDTEHPVLHHAVAELLNAAGQPIDRKQVTFGFRTAEFRADGFYLNGKKTFLRGLNRHQSYPYMRLFHRERVSTKQAINNTVFRRQLNGRAYGSDPDVFFLREENCKLTAEQKRTLATVNALLGNVFLTSDMPSRYTQAQRDEYRHLRTLFEHAAQVQVETENGRLSIRYLLDGILPQKLCFTPF